MGKRITAYQADDGTIFGGQTAQRDMEKHERIVKAVKWVKETKDYVRKVFHIGDGDEYEAAFLEEITNSNVLPGEYELDEFIEWVLRMRAKNVDAFNKFIRFIEKI